MPKVLILGGTNFIGRNLVETLLKEEAWEITLFNRQQSGADLFPEIQKIKGDRNTSDIDQIGLGDWDYVIDLSCYYPHQLKSSLAALPALKRYIFISTCSVYDNEALQVMMRDEQAPLLSCSATEASDTSPATYGRRKAECERILRQSNRRYSILRPALVFGPYDPTDRLYYWLYQAHQMDRLLLPENGEGLFSLTYVHDLVAAIKALLHPDRESAVYNCITQPQGSIRQIIDLVPRTATQKPVEVNASVDFLDRQGIQPWLDLPLWLKGNHFTYSNTALGQDLGIAPSPFDQAIQDTINYYAAKAWPEPGYGLSEDQKQALLQSLQVN